MKHSGGPWIISGMKENNAQHENSVRAFLQDIVKQPQDHALFMNMLSMLEHMGSRKIMLSQMNKTLTEDSLKHLAEEARHAYFFKRQAERVAGHALDGYVDENTMCRVPALMYFGRMDAGISKAVAPDDPYPWVSLIIELRACWLYAIYQDVLDASDLQLSLKSLLAEEDMHLAEMFEMCGDDEDRLKTLSAYETELFGKLWAELCISFANRQKSLLAA
ncbi:MAG: hypothetical protein DHS20C02_12210 [Micavibrio sp.]|nr:MAG: hypothetical protein DHS20C02_12210 [Micavibrio sp.]